MTKKPPKVRIGRPKGRHFTLRYTDPVTRQDVRISIGSRDEQQAQEEKAKLEAKLLLGLDAKPRAKQAGPDMAWEDFREEHSRLKVATFRSEASKESAEVRLDVCERVARPRRLRDMTDPHTLSRLQAELLIGAESKRGKRAARSPATVRGYIRTLLVSLNWAYDMGWLDSKVRFKPLSIDKDDRGKGRPITGEEFERMLDAVDSVCPEGPESWKYLLRGLWESGLRLSEALMMSWDAEDTIRPVWTRRGRLLLSIPAKLQKSHKSQDIPSTDQFSSLLRETPEDLQEGWVFTLDRQRGDMRFTVNHVGRIITRIGRKANVSVNGEGKPASAHDLRRSFGQRMADAGMSSRDLQGIMRHSSIATTEQFYLKHRAEDQAERIAKLLSVPRHSGLGENSKTT